MLLYLLKCLTTSERQLLNFERKKEKKLKKMKQFDLLKITLKTQTSFKIP